MSPSLFWVIALFVFAVAEAATVGLVSIWFAVGALAGFVVSFFTGNLWIQAGVFLLVSFLALVGIKPLADKFFTSRGHQPTNADRVVGQEAVVIEPICNLENCGLVQVMGQDWTARSQTGADIPAHTVVIVDRIEGVKLFVTPKD